MVGKFLQEMAPDGNQTLCQPETQLPGDVPRKSFDTAFQTAMQLTNGSKRRSGINATLIDHHCISSQRPTIV